MANNKAIAATADAVADTDTKPAFKGYTLSDLKYRRAVVALQKEFAKEKIMEDLDHMRGWNPLSSLEGNSKAAKTASLARKVLGGLNYLDYILIGFSLFSSGKKFFRLFRSKK